MYLCGGLGPHPSRGGVTTISVSDPQSLAVTLVGVGPQDAYEKGGDEHLTALVGHTVIAANAVVGAWAALYAGISGHTLAYTAALFDRWAREDVQRARVATLARDFLQKLPRELGRVETLLSAAEGLAHERDLLVGQPWSLGQLDEQLVNDASLMVRSDVAMERECQFEGLLASLHELRREIMETVSRFRLSRDVEKVRLFNQSAVLAAEFKFARRATRSVSGPRHKDWHTSATA